MSTPSSPYGPILEREIWKIYQEFFTLAEKHRRWSLQNDIPWDQCNPNTDPAIASIVESFCAVELFLPDYVGKFLMTFKDYPQRQKAASFNLDEVLEKLKESGQSK